MVNHRLDYGLLLALLLPLFAVMPLLTHAGLPNTADGPAHLMRQVELNQAWQEGNFYPRWGADLALGHGMPIFSYAPPALYQLTQLFHLSGLPLDEAMKAVLALDFLLYSLGMFLLARRLFGPYPALVAAALYVYAPYRLREAYIQGNYGQFTGLAFYPFIGWAFHGLITTGQTRYLLAAAFALAGLLFSHNISFMLFTPWLAAYILFLLILSRSNFRGVRHPQMPHGAASEDAGSSILDLLILAAPLAKRESEIQPATHHHLPFTNYYFPSFISRLGRVAAAVLLGLGLAAIFWLPAFGERHEIQLEGITRGFFDFRENFIAPQEFFALPLPLDRAAINPEFPLSLGLPQLIGAGAGLLGLLAGCVRLLLQRLNKSVYQHPLKPANNQTAISDLQYPKGTLFLTSNLALALFFALFLGFYACLALPQSAPLWAAAPLLALAEFPWRMLGPAIFCASLLGAFPFWILDFRFWISSQSRSNDEPTPHHSSFFSIFYLSSIFIIIALNAYYLYPSQFIVWGTPGPADAFAYEVTSGAIGTTSTGEFLPRHARQRPQPATLWPDYAAGRPPQKVDPASLPPGATVETLYHRSEADAFRITTPAEFTAAIRTLYWPGWQVYLDGRPAPFTVAPDTGLIQTIIPLGQHTLTLQLESTPLRTASLALTLLSLVILLAVAGIAIKKRLTFNFQPSTFTFEHPTPSQFPITSHFFALTAALLIALYLLSRPLAPFFTLQSDPDRPQPAGQVLQVDFGQKEAQKPLLRLVGLDSLPAAVELAGGEAELSATLYWRALQDLEANYSVFLHLDAPTGQTFATVDQAHPDHIPTRNWPPGLYLRNPLRLKIPPNLPPIRYDVTVGLYDRRSGERLAVLPGEATAFKLGSVWLAPEQPPLPQTPLAHFGPHITLWQATYPADDNGSLRLYWQTGQPLDRDYTIFVHLLGAAGALLAQADGAPYAGLYPLSHWQPGQIITDSRPLAPLLARPADLAAIAIGVYDPATGERLPASDASSQPLPNNSFVLPVAP